MDDSRRNNENRNIYGYSNCFNCGHNAVNGSKKIRHVPVINDEQQLVGIVTLSDIREAAPSIFRANEHLEDLQKPIDSIMKKDVITGHPLDFVEK